MEKNILKYSLIFVLFLSFCKPKNISDLEKISRNIWNDRNLNLTNDNVLGISLHKKRKNFVLFWIKYKKKPYKIDQMIKTSIEKINSRTIFFNKFQKHSNDYGDLMKEGIIILSESSGIDDSLDGYLYISKHDNDQDYKLIPLTDYFELLHRLRSQNEKKKTNIEEEIFDEAANYYWNEILK